MTKILLVEDAADLAQVIARELEGAGYAVWVAGDGARALALQAEHEPDLVILDWMLPGMDGLEVMRRLRQVTAVPILMLTARGEEADRVIGLELGADDYMSKPFSMRELLARVRALRRRIEQMQEILMADRQGNDAILRYGSLTLDGLAYAATLDGQPLDLTRTEFELLRLLLSNPGRTFSRGYLLDTVWGVQAVVGDRSVDNAVLRLRKKLGPLGEAVETVWGVGYRLRAEV